MSFKVEWTSAAEHFVREVYDNAIDKHSLARVMEKMDVSLTFQADTYGESRSEFRRIAFEYPLAISFDVFISTRTVVVIDIWTTGST